MDLIQTPLGRVVDLSEGAKTLRCYAFEVSLSALGAIVRSKRSEDKLRGFNEVASQMRDWSRELERAAGEIGLLTAERVQLVSDLVRRRRASELLERAADGARAADLLSAGRGRERAALAALEGDMKRVSQRLKEALDEIVQLGMMASVLARAALIEAASGSEPQRRALTVASQEFATYASKVNDAVAHITAQYRAEVA